MSARYNPTTRSYTLTDENGSFNWLVSHPREILAELSTLDIEDKVSSDIAWYTDDYADAHMINEDYVSNAYNQFWGQVYGDLCQEREAIIEALTQKVREAKQSVLRDEYFTKPTTHCQVYGVPALVRWYSNHGHIKAEVYVGNTTAVIHCTDISYVVDDNGALLGGIAYIPKRQALELVAAYDDTDFEALYGIC
jgi:hypothetical protein